MFMVAVCIENMHLKLNIKYKWKAIKTAAKPVNNKGT